VPSRTLRNLTTESFVRMGTANCSPSPTSQTAHLLPAPHPPASTHPPPRPRRCPPFAPSGVRRLTVSTGNAPRTRRALADRQPRRPLSGAAPDPPACPPRSAPRRLARDGRGREWAAWTPSPPAAVGRPIGVRLEAWRAFHTGAAVGPRQPASPTARDPPPPRARLLSRRLAAGRHWCHRGRGVRRSDGRGVRASVGGVSHTVAAMLSFNPFANLGWEVGGSWPGILLLLVGCVSANLGYVSRAGLHQ